MKRSKTANMVLAAVLAAVTAVLSPFTLPIGPVPVTLGVFCVTFTGAVLPPAYAAASLSVYMGLGFIGLPVFSGFGAGPGVLLGPTGGYLFGYYALVLTLAFGAKLQSKPLLRYGLALSGLAVCYLFGTFWYMAYAGVGFAAATLLCVAPFVLPDIAKIGLAMVLAYAVKLRVKKRGRI